MRSCFYNHCTRFYSSHQKRALSYYMSGTSKGCCFSQTVYTICLRKEVNWFCLGGLVLGSRFLILGEKYNSAIGRSCATSLWAYILARSISDGPASVYIVCSVSSSIGALAQSLQVGNIICSLGGKNMLLRVLIIIGGITSTADQKNQEVITNTSEQNQKPKEKICCACPETKKIRDECTVEHGEDAFTKWIEARKQCLHAAGFNV